jgi:NAD(P)-dependent dehydrogenase (short-subunit alcohol dehydrogenase family)
VTVTAEISSRPVALVTSGGRTAGIGASIAIQLAASGWDIAFTYWTAYDTRMPWGAEAAATDAIAELLASHGAAVTAIEADLTDAGSPGHIFDEAERQRGDVTTLVMCHCESVDSGLLDTTIESFDRHFAVSARATWLNAKVETATARTQRIQKLPRSSSSASVVTAPVAPWVQPCRVCTSPDVDLIVT